MNIKELISIIGVFIIGAFLFTIPLATSAQSVDLKKIINQKTKELKAIHEQIQATEKQLLETERKQKSLDREIKRSAYTIRQLTLTLKSNLISIDKLGLEIQELNNNIKESERQIELKTKAIRKILREMQIKDNEPLVATILKNESLSESLSEINNLQQLRSSLSDDIRALISLKSELEKQRSLVTKKKIKVEEEYQTSKVRKSLLEEKQQEHKQLLALTKNEKQTYEAKLRELAKRQEEIAREIETIEAELRKQINPDLLPEFRPGVLAYPVPGARITQNYGKTKFSYNYKGRRHNGIDFAAPFGTPVRSAEEGIVINIGNSDQYCPRGAYGKFIVVKHFNNLTTLYAHLSRIAVEPGDKVKRGEVIGYMGSTGFSTGSHVHFTVYDSHTFQMKQSRICGLLPFGGDIDPNKYL